MCTFFHAFLYLPLYSHILFLPDPDALVHICPKLATYDRGNFLLESVQDWAFKPKSDFSIPRLRKDASQEKSLRSTNSKGQSISE